MHDVSVDGRTYQSIYRGTRAVHELEHALQPKLLLCQWEIPAELGDRLSSQVLKLLRARVGCDDQAVVVFSDTANNHGADGWKTL